MQNDKKILNKLPKLSPEQGLNTKQNLENPFSESLKAQDVSEDKEDQQDKDLETNNLKDKEIKNDTNNTNEIDDFEDIFNNKDQQQNPEINTNFYNDDEKLEYNQDPSLYNAEKKRESKGGKTGFPLFLSKMSNVMVDISKDVMKLSGVGTAVVVVLGLFGGAAFAPVFMYVLPPMIAIFVSSTVLSYGTEYIPLVFAPIKFLGKSAVKGVKHLIEVFRRPAKSKSASPAKSYTQRRDNKPKATMIESANQKIPKVNNQNNYSLNKEANSVKPPALTSGNQLTQSQTSFKAKQTQGVSKNSLNDQVRNNKARNIITTKTAKAPNTQQRKVRNNNKANATIGKRENKNLQTKKPIERLAQGYYTTKLLKANSSKSIPQRL